MSTLRAERVTKAFGGVVAVKNASIDLEDGVVAGLIGPNGAGKSTFLSILSGFLRPDSGKVTLDKHDVSRIGPSHTARLGLVRTFQEAAPIAGLSVLDNVRVGMHTRFHNGPFSAILHLPSARHEETALRHQAQFLLAEVGLSNLADVNASRLTFGQLRFLEIARALAASPRLLLLDEPTAGLNATESQLLAELIGRIRQSSGLGLLLVDHNVPFLFNLCDRITVMNYGEIIAEGAPRHIEKDPAVHAAYLGTEESVELEVTVEA
ncbi:MAG: ABC transporter ATP-binding protein [Chloroflexi bacterium]|nr:ABC transporter ATP-binding protein [Chloroflexota bacterium]